MTVSVKKQFDNVSDGIQNMIAAATHDYNKFCSNKNMNVLHVCANPKPTEDAVSKQLASAFLRKLIELKPEVELVNMDLYEEKPPFYSYDLYKRIWNPIFNNIMKI